jgi:hypothetical protein
MTPGTTELNVRERELLQKVVQDRAGGLSPLVKAIGSHQLTQDEREALRGALASELTAVGLDQTDEPTQYGRELDALIGRLMYF